MIQPWHHGNIESCKSSLGKRKTMCCCRWNFKIRSCSIPVNIKIHISILNLSSKTKIVEVSTVDKTWLLINENSDYQVHQGAVLPIIENLSHHNKHQTQSEYPYRNTIKHKDKLLELLWIAWKYNGLWEIVSTYLHKMRPKCLLIM